MLAFQTLLLSEVNKKVTASGPSKMLISGYNDLTLRREVSTSEGSCLLFASPLVLFPIGGCFCL